MAQKIAAITENGIKISSHFGRAELYRVYTVEEGQIVAEEERAKPNHAHQSNHLHIEHDHGEHGHGEHLDVAGHGAMFAPIADCQVLIAGGMGEPAYQKAIESGLEVVLTGGEIRQAVERYLKGEVTSDSRRVHRH